MWAIKGRSLRGAPLWPRRPARPKPGGPPLYIVSVDAANEIVVARLSLEGAGPGCCHFPIGGADAAAASATEAEVQAFVDLCDAVEAESDAIDAEIEAQGHAAGELPGKPRGGGAVRREPSQRADFRA